MQHVNDDEAARRTLLSGFIQFHTGKRYTVKWFISLKATASGLQTLSDPWAALV
jgi:hypothetical protein